jgi:hypothetical protein
MATIELTTEKISRLRHVNRHDLKPGRYEFPDFLLIGPQRTGTSWLHENLCFHPEIFMPSKKELYFFNKLITKSGANYTSDRLEWYSARFTPGFSDIIRQNALHLKNTRSLGSLNFSFKKLFSPCMKGEATASYAVMKESLIEEIALLNPDIKTIMLIRNPLERAWSHAKKDLLRQTQKTLQEVSIDDFKKFYSKDYQLRCGGYSEIIRKWGLIIGRDKFFIGMYDDIETRPNDLLRNIFSFLGVSDSREHINSLLSSVVINKTTKEVIPERHRAFLLDLFRDELEELNQTFKMRWN